MTSTIAEPVSGSGKIPGLLKPIVTRIAYAFGSLVAISLITFLATAVLPGDPARKALGIFSTAQQRAQFDKLEGLNHPAFERYFVWLGQVIRGNWGRSLISNTTVTSLVSPRVGHTAVIALGAFALALPIALALGLYAARHSGGRFDAITSTVAISVAALPEFVVALLLLLLLAADLRLLPIDSSAVAYGSGAQKLKAYVLPMLSLAVVYIPYLYRLVRAVAREVYGSPYIRGARLRGVRGARLTVGHVVPNTLLPLGGALALSLAELLGGIVIVENVFGFPGLGQLLVESVRSGDVPVVQAITLLIATAFIVLNGLADAFAYALNPRLRHG